MLREDLITEISMRTDIPMTDVEEVLDEEDIILEEELCKCRKRRCIITTVLVVMFLLGVTVAVYVLDRKEKIDVEKIVKKYTEKIKEQLDKKVKER